MPEPLPIPRYPLLILTPRPTDLSVHESKLPNATARLLERLVRRILNSSADYSVTYSPVLCPQGPNWLYTLKPYYWNVDGKWVQRDGQRNPYCDKPQGQNQLQELSLSIRSLSLGAKHLPDLSRECTTKAETLLRTFFMHPSTRMEPEVLYAQCMPGQDPLRGDQAFVIAIRYLIMVTQCVPLLTLPADLDTALRDWFGRQVNWCRSSPQGEKARNYGNNITIWYHAIVASHLSYLAEEESIAYSLITCEYLQRQYPSPQSFFARELSRSRPRHYTLFTLEPTFILAECSSPRNRPPPADILSWLQSLVRFAAEVAPSEIEVEIEGEPRYTSKLAWFEAMLRVWEGGSKGDPPNASGWEGGWNQTARLSWDFL